MAAWRSVGIRLGVAALLAGVAAGAAAAQLSCGPSQLGSPCGAGGPATLAEPGAGTGAGNPVHLATGNKHQRDVDLPGLPGPLGLELVRIHNAFDPRMGMFGPAWVSSYDTRVYRVGGNVQVVQADGSRIDFIAAGPVGPCAPADPAHGSLDVLAEGGYRWRWPDGRELDFDAGGGLVGIATPAGARLTLLRGQVPGQPAHGRVVRVADPQGRALVFDYDAAGRAVRARTPAGDIRYTYDAAGRLAGAHYPDGHARLYTYDAAQQRAGRTALATIRAATPAASQTVLGRWTYDDAGRVVQAELPGLPQAAGRLAFHYEDEAGAGRRAVQVRDEAGHSTRFVLAPERGRYRVASAEGPGCVGCPPPGLPYGGLAAALAASAPPVQGDAQVWRRPSVVSGRAAHLEVAWAQSPGPGGLLRVPASVRETGWRVVGGQAHAIERRWELHWDAGQGVHRLASARRTPRGLAAAGWLPADTPAEPAWPGLRVSRDDFGAITAWAADATGEQTWHYGPDGALLARRHANGDHWRYTYDTQGRLATAQAGEFIVRIGWQAGLPAEIVHPDEHESRRHDAQGRLAERRLRRPADGSRLDLREAYVRDDQGRVLRHALPEGGALLYRWSEGGRLLGLAWEDAGGRRHDILRAPVAGAGYVYGNGVSLLTWLHEGRLAGLAHAHGPAGRASRRLLWAQGLAYDAVGRIAHERLRGALGGAQAWRYAYDAQGRLATSASGAGVEHYRWQADGRRAALDEPIARDASGLPRHVDGFDLTYGPQRRLAAVARDGRILVRHAHNAFGERIAAWPAGTPGPQDFLYDGHALAAVWQDGAIRRRYVHAQGVPVAMIEHGPGDTAPALYFLHADAVGLPRLVTDARGVPRWQGWYSPFGALVAAAGDPALAPAVRLPGQVADPLTGWHDNHQRTYDPRRGQYLEPDPLGPAALHAHTLPQGVALRTSPFGYAAQQPRRYADPAGLLLLAFDGTRSDARRGGNVYQFALLYRGDPAADDTLAVGYEPGPGDTDRVVDLDALLAQSAQRILDVQWARLIARLRAAEPDDAPTPIDLVGYSRGASLARHFAGELAGLVRQGRFWQWQAGIGAVTGCVELRFVGLFDSVAQFGLLGSRNDEFDFTVTPVWGAVAHAVALHEHRQLFPLHSLADAQGRLPANTVELPFVGAHADIGGGLAWRDGDVERADLSDIALQWMLGMAQQAGVAMDAPLPAQAEVTGPLLHDMRGADEQATEALRNGWEAGRAANAGVFRPGLLYYDRAVFAADGTRLAASQHTDARLGMVQRRRTEAFIRRVESWLDVSGSVAGEVDLPAYEAWLRAREPGLP